MLKLFIYINIVLLIISCTVIPKEAINKQKTQALNEIELAVSSQANKYAIDDLNNAISLYNEAQKYLADETNDVSVLAYNNFLASKEQAKLAKQKASLFYTKDLIDKNIEYLEKNKIFFTSVGVYQKYSIQNYYNLLDLSNNNITSAQQNAFKLFEELYDLKKHDSLSEDNSLKRFYLNQDKIFFENGKAKVKARLGDNLRKISKDFLGNTSLWRSIYEINRANILDPEYLIHGQKIILPVLKEKAK